MSSSNHEFDQAMFAEMINDIERRRIEGVEEERVRMENRARLDVQRGVFRTMDEGLD